MSGPLGPVANAVDFERRFGQAVTDYECRVRQSLRALRNALDPPLSAPTQDDENLEAQIRAYIIDPLLSALNWSIDENLTIETTVRSIGTGTRRRLDYLGVERDTTRPLLVVEAKRPNTPLPRPFEPGEEGNSFRYEDILAAALSTLKIDASGPIRFSETWQRWVRELFDYVRSLGTPPGKVVITNGDWLFIFEDPRNAFIDSNPVSSAKISVYQDRNVIRQHAGRVFESLDYHRMIPHGRPLEPVQLVAHISPNDIAFAVRALLITYADTPTPLDAVPTIHVLPELLLYRRDGGWLRVRANQTHRLPHRPREMRAHLRHVQGAHEELRRSVEGVLGRRIRIAHLNETYNNTTIASYRPGVQRANEQSFLLTTGIYTHFIVARRQHNSCPFHSANAADAHGAGLGVIVPRPSASYTTHFGDGTINHCAHRAIRQIKEAQIDGNNRDRFSPRGGIEDGPFCKVWGFEKFLCCQTCAFRDICKQSILAMMPCQTG